MDCRSSGFQNHMHGKKEFERLLTISVDMQLKKFSNNKVLRMPSYPRREHCVHQFLKMPKNSHVQEQETPE